MDSAAFRAPLGTIFYPATGSFPAAYHGDAFVALHGCWNRAVRTGYKIIRLPLRDENSPRRYEDLATGFVAASGQVWGRPVDVAVAHDEALLTIEDGNDTIWRIAPN